MMTDFGAALNGGGVLHGSEEALAVARRHYRGLVRGLDGVGVAVADDALGAHRVNDFFEQPGLLNPRGDVEPHGVTVRGRLQIDEADERGAAPVEEAGGEVRALAVP